MGPKGPRARTRTHGPRHLPLDPVASRAVQHPRVWRASEDAGKSGLEGWIRIELTRTVRLEPGVDAQDLYGVRRSRQREPDEQFVRDQTQLAHLADPLAKHLIVRLLGSVKGGHGAVHNSEEAVSLSKGRVDRVVQEALLRSPGPRTRDTE